MKYLVTVPEIWYQTYEVEADDEDHAMSLVSNGLGTALGDPVYSHVSDGEAEVELQ